MAEFGLIDPEYLASLPDIQRRKALAAALQEQAMQQPDPARSSGRYVIPYSPLEGLAKLGQSYFAGKAAKAVGEQEKEALVAALRRQQEAKDAATEGLLQPEQVQGMGFQPDPNSLYFGNAKRVTKVQAKKGEDGGGSTPVTPVTIQDPKDPSKTVVVDGRTGRVIGAGPKLTQTGTADQKLALGLPQARLRIGSVSQNLDRLGAAIADLQSDPGLAHITGTIAGRTPNLTNLATGAQAKLDSIKSQIFVEALQAMREASKTGGAVGNVSDREGDKLENTLAALNQAQGTEDFKIQLGKALEQLRLSKARLQAAFDETYGGVQEGAGPAAAPTATRKVVRTGTRNGKKVVQYDDGSIEEQP